MPKILTFGEIIWDVYPDKKLIGGAGLNFAAHAARCGAESYVLSAVGNDMLGEDALASAEGFGVRTELIEKTSKPTGQCTVALDKNGIPSYNVLDDVAYDNIVISASDVATINQLEFDAIYFGTLIQRSETSRNSLRRLISECDFKNKICDVNLRKNCFDSASVLFCLKNATVLKISDEEEPDLRAFGYYHTATTNTIGIARALSERFSNLRYIIITLGEKGAFVYCTKENHHFTLPSAPVKVASTVGAGDSFIAAWTTSFLSGSTPEEATKNAVKLSTFVVSRTDAIPDYSFKKGELIEM